jgi:aspartyl-tRNA(Asn)/glutamyl-tRNA(Gln) amidotransferase subunit B
MSTKTAVSPSEFELVSGLEIHVQLNTQSKIFSSDSASFGAKPNANISAVSLALPGALPKLNKEVVAKAIRMGLALNCTINQINYFDRKNYFYADLPKGYQITQDNKPICQNGFLNVTLSMVKKRELALTGYIWKKMRGKACTIRMTNTRM